MQQHRPFSIATWCLYLLLLAVRVFVAISPGYIHPDEFFQSAEITAGQVFDIHVDTPWEYNPQLPCRSILVPAITTGLPFLLLKTWIGNDTDRYVTTRELFLTQRLVFVLISIIIDWAVVRMARQIRRSPSIALLLVSSSYVTLAYHTHPFSNTVETVVLALCAVLLGRIIRDHDTPPAASEKATGRITVGQETSSSPVGDFKATSAHLSSALGVLFAIGTFTRITFVLYGFPLGVMFLYINIKACFKKETSLLKGLGQFIKACIPLALGLGFMSAVAVLIDSIYFGKLVLLDKTTGIPVTPRHILATAPQNWIHFTFKGSLAWTMLNNLHYNLDESNLAQHGLHPRYLHLLVNYPVLFTNLAWIAVIAVFQKIKAGQWCSESKLVTALAYSGIFGISLLSVMPHQEARFLTPLIIPLVVSLSGRISKLGRKFWPLWLVINVVMAIVFGIFHQAGLVPAIDLVQHQAIGFQVCQEAQPDLEHTVCMTDPLRQGALHLQDGMSYSTRVIFYKTYMPPQHLLGYTSRFAEMRGVNLTIADWRTKSQDELLNDLHTITVKSRANVNQTLLKSLRAEHGQQVVLFRRTKPRSFERTVLIAPATIDFSTQDFYGSRDRIPWHADFDRIQVILQNPQESLYLNVFYL